MALSGNQLTSAGGFAPHVAYAAFTAKEEGEAAVVIGQAVIGLINTRGQGVSGAITSAGQGVVSANIESSFAVIGLINSRGQGVTGISNATGQGVTGDI